MKLRSKFEETVSLLSIIQLDSSKMKSKASYSTTHITHSGECTPSVIIS